MRQYNQAITIDGAGTIASSSFAPDATQASFYETQVASILDNIKATVAGQVLLREITSMPMGKSVRIIPIAFGTQDARTIPADTAGSVPSGETLAFPNSAPVVGTGAGSNVTVRYDMMTWLTKALQTGQVQNLMPDDVLVHELLHALRMQAGKIRLLDMGNASHNQKYGNREEFLAMMVADIYVSERNAKYGANQALRANIGPVSGFQAMSNAEAAAFYLAHKDAIDRFSNEMTGLVHGGGAQGLIHSPARFNPLRDAQQAFDALRRRMAG